MKDNVSLVVKCTYFTHTAKILWQSDSLQMLDEEKQTWESIKEGELAKRLAHKLDEEKLKWRNTGLISYSFTFLRIF